MTSQAQPTEAERDRLETKIGIVIAIFAAILAINGLGAGRFGDDEQQAIIEKSNQFSWYQAKSIKKGLAEGQAELLGALKDAGVIAADRQIVVDQLIDRLQAKSDRYDSEAKVILNGSKASEKESWFANLDDDMRNVIGAAELGAKAAELGQAGDMFDFGELFLQISVVFGAICLVVKRAALKRGFYWVMILLGLVGTTFVGLAFHRTFEHL